MNHDEVGGYNYKVKKVNAWIMLDKMCYVLLLVVLHIVKLCKKLQVFQ